MRKEITTKERLRIQRQNMPEQDSAARANNFREVNLGFTEQLALLEADRCLQCKDPALRAARVRCGSTSRDSSICSPKEKSPKPPKACFATTRCPAITGRVCPQETQCEAECVRGGKGSPVGIGYLERFVADWARTQCDGHQTTKPTPTGKTHRDCRLRARGLDRSRGTRPPRPRSHDLRSAPQTRRRAGLWHSGISPAEKHCRAGSPAIGSRRRED